MTTILLPTLNGRLERYTVAGQPLHATTGPPVSTRVAFAAVHVVSDPLADTAPDGPAVVDWEATLQFRHHIWSHGLGVAEAMDTAQRGMGLDWPACRELIARSCADAKVVGGRIACGAGTDQLPPGTAQSLEEVIEAYTEQIDHITACGGQVILMASRQLAARASSPDDYLKVYDRLLNGASAPVILHWLGPLFDPALDGYWGSTDVRGAADTVLEIITEHRDRVDGIKVSLGDADLEVDLRRRLPNGVRLYTGDDWNYLTLIEGDERGYSDALLGVFAAIAPAAAMALRALDAGDGATYRDLLGPTVPLARTLFEAPTYYYKTGIVFLAYLNGHQEHFRMLAGMDSMRPVVHLAELFRLADAAGLLADPETAVPRMGDVLRVAGISQERGK